MRTLLTVAGSMMLAVAPLGAPRSAPFAVPEVHATLLSGVAVNLPADLHGRPLVIVMGFSQGSREQVAAWGRRLAPDFHGSKEVAYYEAAELESVPRLLRGWVMRKIKDTVPERAHGHFFTVLDHEAEWKAAANFQAKDDAYVLLIDPGGKIRYTTHGPTSDATYADLKARVDDLRKP